MVLLYCEEVDLSEDIIRRSPAARRYRPGGRSPQRGDSAVPTVLTKELEGVAAAYGDALLFIGFEVNSRIEVVVYPRYRFGADDRVQGHIGTLWVEPGTPWESILQEVDALQERAGKFYQAAVSLRSRELQTYGARFERAYDDIAEIFRESWHGFALRLQREYKVSKDGTTFEGAPPGPVLVTWRNEPYTLLVAPTGSILVLRGDRRAEVAELLS